MRRLFGQTILVCLLFSTLFVAGKGNNITSEYHDSLRSVYLYTEGLKQIKINGDSIKGDSCFTAAIRLDSNYAPAYYELAASRLNSKNTQQAIELSHRAHNLDTTNKWYLALYGRALLTGREYETAVGVYQKLYKLDSNNPTNYSILASLYEQAQQPYSAIAVLNTAEERFGRISILSEMKRHLHINTRQYDKAIEEAQKLVEIAPYEIENHVVLGKLYGIKGQDSLAVVQFEQALRLDSTKITTLLAFADYYKEKQNYLGLLSITNDIFTSDQMELAEKVSRLKTITSDNDFYRSFYRQINTLVATLAIKYPSEDSVIKLYADHMLASGEIDQALNHYKRHIRGGSQNKDFYKAIIEMESYFKHQDSVVLYIEKALEIHPNDPDIYIFKGHVYSRESMSKALRAYYKALKYSKDAIMSSTIWGYIGDLYHANISTRVFGGLNIRRSYNAYDKALELNPENVFVLNNYAYFLITIPHPRSSREESLQKAVEMAKLAVSIEENNATYLDTYAWALFKSEKLELARKVMRQAISLNKDKSPELYIHYGDILEALGESYLAEIYWLRAWENGYDKAIIDEKIKMLKK